MGFRWEMIIVIQTEMKLFELCIQLFTSRTDLLQIIPKPLAMILMLHVRKFVENDIVTQSLRKSHEFTVETNTVFG